MKEYRSAIRSRNMIKKAFFELLSKKNANEITVVDVVNAADISRNTFYAHYNDIYAVLNEIENDFIDKLNIYIGDNVSVCTADDYPLYLLQKIARFIEADAESSGIFIVDPDFDRFGEKIKSVIKTRLKAAYNIADNAENFEFNALTECVSSGFLSLCKKSFKGEISASIDDISTATSQFFITNVKI